MTFKETVAFCDIHTKPVHRMCSKIQSYRMLQQMVHTVTTGLLSVKGIPGMEARAFVDHANKLPCLQATYIVNSLQLCCKMNDIVSYWM
jgi:hypothetical protein